MRRKLSRLCMYRNRSVHSPLELIFPVTHPPPGDPHSQGERRSSQRRPSGAMETSVGTPAQRLPQPPSGGLCMAWHAGRWAARGAGTWAAAGSGGELSSGGKRNFGTRLPLGPRSDGTDASGKRNFMKGELVFSVSYIRRQKQVQLRTNLVKMVNGEF